jgi:hypothetical protein
MCIFYRMQTPVGYIDLYSKKVKLCRQQALEVHAVVRRPRSHIFWTLGFQMAMRWSARNAGRPLAPSTFLVLILVRGSVNHRITVQLQELGKWKIIMTSLGIERATCRFVAKCVNKLRYRVKLLRTVRSLCLSYILDLFFGSTNWMSNSLALDPETAMLASYPHSYCANKEENRLALFYMRDH